MPISKIKMFIFLVLIGTLGLAQDSQAEICEAASGHKCWYIATDGNDSNEGSFLYPWKTFQNAVSSRIQPGDYIYIREGIYSEKTSIYGTNAVLPLTNYASFLGNADIPITFKSYPGEIATIDALSRHEADADPVIIRGANKKGIILENLEMRNSFGRACIFIEDNASDITIRNNKIYNADGGDNVGGIYLSASQNILIENNLIYDNYKRLSPDNGNNAGIFVFSGTTNIHIKNNEIYNSVQGIFYKHSGYGSSLFENNFFHDLIGSALLIASDNVTMKNNLIINVNRAFNIHEEAGCVNCTRDSIIEHNTVYGSNFFTLNRGSDRPGAIRTIIRNNIFSNLTNQSPEIWRYGSDSEYLNNTAQYGANHNDYQTPSLTFNYFGGSGSWGDLGGVYTLEQFQSQGYEESSFNADPRFVNLSGSFSRIGDFMLNEESPARNVASDGKDMGADVSLVGPNIGVTPDLTLPASPGGLSVN